ncbi:MAG: MFS transporter, partial [Anaerolineae bacterium]|nr:MFS transporter [Anaerolineae bacterium]
MPFTPHIPPSLKHRRFFYLWLGSTLSIIGTRMQVWALFWHIDQLTHSPLALGMVGAARVVPIVVFSLFGGVIADAFDRRKMMFLTQAVMVVEASTLGLLTLTGRIELWHIYALTALQALAFAFDNPASQALLPNLVPRKDLSNALTVRAMAFQVGAILGPALAGFIIEWVGIPFTYLINAFSFVAVFIALLLIGKVEQEGSQEIKPGQRITLGSIKDGLKFTFGQPIIFSSMVLDFLATFFARII